MTHLELGDIVVRKSYSGDIFFKIQEIKEVEGGERLYVLKGTNMRILADSLEEDLVLQDKATINENSEHNNKKINAKIQKILLERKGSQRSLSRGKSRGREFSRGEGGSIGKAGKVLHIDGDEEYLGVCLKGYQTLGVEAVGVKIPEAEQSIRIIELLIEHRPDILVLTGHDGLVKGVQNFKKIENYRSSGHFVDAVKRAREFEGSYDNLFIFAGACQSHFEALIQSGANFASSPYRVLIHAMDPVFICEKIAYGSIKNFLSPQEVLENTITGDRGIGGFETRGTYREGTSKSPYS